MSDAAAGRPGPITDDEIAALFAGLEGRPLALAVSGGVDSTALMHIVARWRKLATGAESAPLHVSPEAGTVGGPWWLADRAGEAASPPPVVVLTVDHGLRAEAAAEARRVAAAAHRLGFPCAILRWEGAKPTTGIQEAARDARRGLMTGLLDAEARAMGERATRAGLPRAIVMAHHLEDQAETFVMRLARGSGLDGLRAMTAVSHAGIGGGAAGGRNPITIIRPFLDVSRPRLEATLRASGIDWSEDESNGDLRFERVRIRRALAELGRLGVGAEQLATSTRRLAEAAAWIEFAERHHGAPDRFRFMREISWNAGVYASIPLAARASDDVPPYAMARTLRQVIATCGGPERAAELKQVERLTVAIRSRDSQWPDDMTLGGCRIVFVRGRPGGDAIHVFREGAGTASPAMTCKAGQTIAWDGGRFAVTAAADAPPVIVIRALGVTGWAELKRIWPDLARLGWPAAAAATLPVAAAGGRIVGHPGLDLAVTGLPEAYAALKARWAAAGGGRGAFSARFEIRPW